MDDLYRDFILEHYKRPRNFGELPSHDHDAHEVNPLCGDELGVQIVVADGRIADLRFQGHGCAISQAAASMASEELIGRRSRGGNARRRLDAGPARHPGLSDPAQVRAAVAQGRPTRPHRRRKLVYMVYSGQLTLGSFWKVHAYIALLYAPMQWFAQVNNWFSRAMAGAERVFEVIDSDSEAYGDSGTHLELRGEVRFENVRFGYDKSNPVLKGLTFSAGPGNM